jgi:STE24 endopeptidase
MEQLVLFIIPFFLVGTFVFNLWLSIMNYKNRLQPIPKNVSDIYAEEDYKKWLSYNMENFRLGLISSSFDLVILLILLFSGLFIKLNDIAVQLTNVAYFQTLIFLGLYFLIGFVFDVGFSYYSQFSIEERYGFNKSTKKTFVFDKIKGIFLMIIFGGGLVNLLQVLYVNFGNMFYVYAWISIVLILLFTNLFYVKLIVPLFNKLTPLADGELKDKIVAFAESVGYEVSKISVIDASKRSTKLNAYFSGLGKMKQVVLYDTLLEKMGTDEIVAVLAHEIGHNKHKHLVSGLTQSILVLSLYLGALLFTLSSPILSTAFGFDGAHFGFGIIIFSVLLSPISIIINAISSGISRKHEYQADKYAKDHGYQTAMIAALKTLAKENFSNLTPHPIYVKLTYSHPPISSRIAAIEKDVNNE